MISLDDERRRLAKSLDDDFSQYAAAIRLQVDCLLETLDDRLRAQRQLRAMRSQLEVLSEGLRRTSRDLYPSLLSDLGLLPALQQLAREFQAKGLDVMLHAVGALPEQTPAETGIALYRIAEEAIENIAKYTGSAPIQITVWVKEGMLQMLIEDAVGGFGSEGPSARNGLGLLRMRERARLAGGSLSITTEKGKGTQVIVLLPLQ